jgi:hypothetical protein
MTKAAVLPEPVGAEASMSRPCAMAGMLCIWMGVGSSHLDASMFCSSTRLMCSSVIVAFVKGKGT